MSSSNPLISVIIPAYNAEKYLKEALESIIKQNYDPLEIIFVDDGSTDNTAKIVREFGHNIIYVYQENSGPSVARNTGLKVANGEYITFLDADDFWHDNHLKNLLNCFNKNPNLEVAMGLIQLILLNQDQEGNSFFKEFSRSTANVNLAAGLYKKSIFEKVGYFDPKLRSADDVDFYLRIKEAGIKIEMIDNTSLYYRIHNSNLSKDRASSKSDFLKAVKISLDRRRHKSMPMY